MLFLDAGSELPGGCSGLICVPTRMLLIWPDPAR
jgi:hypothetical protein